MYSTGVMADTQRGTFHAVSATEFVYVDSTTVYKIDKNRVELYSIDDTTFLASLSTALLARRASDGVLSVVHLESMTQVTLGHMRSPPPCCSFLATYSETAPYFATVPESDAIRIYLINESKIFDALYPTTKALVGTSAITETSCVIILTPLTILHVKLDRGEFRYSILDL